MTVVFAGGLFVPVQDGAEPFDGHLVVGDDGRVVAAGPGAPPPGGGEVVDLGGRIVVPGFVSAHSHLWQSVHRGVADGCGTYAWIDRLHKRRGPAMTEETMYAATLHGGADLLRHGVTTVCNHTHDFGRGADGQWRAVFDLPQRTVYAFSSTRWATAAERTEGIRRFRELTEGVDDPRVLGYAVNTTGVLDPAEMRKESALLREYGFAQHAHYLEDPSAADRQRAEWPLLLDGDRVGPDAVFAHFVHTTDEIVRTAGRLGAAMAWNPLSNGRLGSGVPDVAACRAAGMRVGLGLDGQASADVADPFQNMRTGLYLLRAAARDAAAMSAREVLRAHTLGAAEVLGVQADVGSLEPGKYADFAVLDPERPSTGPVGEDVYAHTVLALSAANISAVHVGGVRVATGPLGS
ncbi:amidohydrolase family protein [Actinomadura atramentaria]|uniref:amidohydrolase family protein n=1 Tax=Actinomadura atramentaria TaxID=1990 RepID=UPI00037D7C1F|nr:amidohydrolase family protein [Actinomadura atramentaria]